MTSALVECAGDARGRRRRSKVVGQGKQASALAQMRQLMATRPRPPRVETAG